MPPTSDPHVSRGQARAGQIMSGIVILFLAFDCGVKLLRLPQAVEGTVQLGYPVGTVFGLGLVLLLCLALYAVPSTAVIGAMLLTGYLGGAVATQVRVGNRLLTHVLFPVYVGLLMWGGLYLREGRLRSLVPLRRSE